MILSICIPTFNRSHYLIEALESILASAKGYESEIEIVISDNAGSDNTQDLVRQFQSRYDFIRYSRNKENIKDKNFYVAATLARGRYAWIFSDDDKISKEAIGRILSVIKQGYTLVICNQSVHSKGYEQKIRDAWLSFEKDAVLVDANSVMSEIGPKLGFISSVVFEKELLFRLSEREYDRFVDYGFAFMYALYYSIRESCNAYVIAQSIVLARGANSSMDTARWYRSFSIGNALIFKELLKRGYSRSAINLAKDCVLTDYIVHDLSFRRRNAIGLSGVSGYILPYYYDRWRFWVFCMPLIVLPRQCIVVIHKIYGAFRGICA